MAGFLALFGLAIITRLAYLQMVRHEEFKAFAESQQVTTNINPAQRGTIYMKANKTGEPAVLAENLTLYQLYVDPNPYNDKDFDDQIDREYIANELAPLLFLHFCGDSTLATDSMDSCEDQVKEFAGTTRLQALTSRAVSTEDDTEGEGDETEVAIGTSLDDIVLSEDAMKELIRQTILDKIAEREVVFVPLKYTNDPSELEMAKEKLAGLPGIVVGEGVIYGNPKNVRHVSSGKLGEEYEVIEEFLNISMDELNTMLTRRLSRYAFLVRRVTPEMKALIEDLKQRERKCPQLYHNPETVEGLIDASEEVCQRLNTTEKGRHVKNFFSVALRDENWRSYPEETIAAQVAGFLNFEKQGNYGVEEEYDTLLKGEDGSITLESDPMGRLIASNLKADQIQERRDGVDLYLTIDRTVQRFVEERLRQKVVDTRANSGVAIVMDPYTGDVVAMAQYPTYNPNFYQESYQMKETYMDPGKGRPMFIRNEDGELINVPEYDRGSISPGTKKYVYENLVGPGAFMNLAVQQPYEPGSIFKPLIVAAGIDANEITPDTMYHDRGELKVDEFTIRNVSDKCLGYHDMVNVLNYSCNIGMSFIAQKMGKALLHKYIIDFGFNEKSDIELPNEAKGLVYPFEEWSNARLFNAAFGQGLTTTPIQLAQAYSVLANGGILINPRIVDKIQYGPEGRIEETPIKTQYRVIAKETADTLSAMLTQVVEKGGSKNAKVEGYYVGGKTGTAQIASSRGGYEDDPVGSTIGSFAGYLPSDNPRYVIITKIERPRTTKWADQSAAPLFQEIAEFLVKYYNIPPNR